MSISGAMHNAYSGLTTTSKTAETISNNVANALTEGYSRQISNVTASVTNGVGSGVRTDGIARAADTFVTSARRTAEAQLSASTTSDNAKSRLAALLGTPDDPNALALKMSSFDSNLRRLQSTPDSTSLQQQVVADATTVTRQINAITTEATRIRVNADANIAKQVSEVNSALKQLEGLNAQIRVLSMSGRSVTPLEDQRQMLIDKINTIVPIRESHLETGEVSIYTKGGGVLLNGSAREIGFSPTAMMTQSMTLGSGALSGLTIEGLPADHKGALSGGSLEAEFAVRDEIVPEFQSQLDVFARDLIVRFQDPAVDPTLGAGDAGLFTDGGSAFLIGAETGIAGRISVNAQVRPDAGGAVWRIRDGLNAGAPGPAANDNIVTNMIAAMDRGETSPADAGIAAVLSSTNFAVELSTVWAARSADQASQTATKRGSFETFKAEERIATGVDTDAEMQHLLAIEKAYAANAKVMSVVDELMARLLEI